MNVNVVNLMLCESYLKNLSFSCLDVFPLSEVSLPELIVGLEALRMSPLGSLPLLEVACPGGPS